MTARSLPPALLLLLASNAVIIVRVQAQSGATSSNDGDACSHEGEEKKLASTTWSTCHNGRYVPSACVADDGSKVAIGLTVRQRNYVYECRQTSIGGSSTSSLALSPTACLRQKSGTTSAADKVVVEPGQRVTDPPFIYECVRQAPATPTNPNSALSLALKAVACANKTSEIPDGGTVEMGGFTYNCTRQTGSLTDNKGDVFLRAKGCLYNRKEYPLDSTAIIGNFAYKCKMTEWPSSTLSFSVIGCAYQGKRYEEGEKFHASGAGNRVVVQCRNYNNSKWAATPIACVDDSDQEHEIGDTWIDDGGQGDKRLKYIVECRGDGKGVVQTPVSCVYQPNPNDFSTAATIKAGCMKKFTKPNTLVKCTEDNNDGSVTAEVVTVFLNLKKEEDAAMRDGLKYC